MTAARMFNPEISQFSTYATGWIKQKISRYIEEKKDSISGPEMVHQAPRPRMEENRRSHRAGNGPQADRRRDSGEGPSVQAPSGIRQDRPAVEESPEP